VKELGVGFAFSASRNLEGAGDLQVALDGVGLTVVGIKCHDHTV
jgi:hypothetical protein